eukprot:gene11054-23110_t
MIFPLLLVSLLILVDSQYICSGSGRGTRDFHFHGTALGGWLVLEPWLTPSLFYQFLGASEKWGDDAKNKVALDSYSFCTALGPQEANRQLRHHWNTWVTEEHIYNMSMMGVDTLRIPVADWMYIPYEPYIGCWDGAMEQLQRGIALCKKYGIKVMLDLHAMKDSQNGLDNSGVSANIEWIGIASRDNVTRYKHWDIRAGNWAGHFNITSGRYDSINMANIAYSIAVVAQIVETHKNDPTIVAFEPINEPTYQIPLDVLKHFYWESYKLVQAKAPDWITVFHDSFRLTPENWVDFMPGCPNYAFDSHIYQAWADAAPMNWFNSHACADGNPLRTMEGLGIPVIVGEWSLAIDNCAMWLNGVNDNVYGYPKVKCEMVTCPAPYFGSGVVPNAPVDVTKGPQDPFGTGESYVSYGKCPRDHYIENEDKSMRSLAMAKLYAFDLHTHGQFFWNFRTEFEPRWDFMQAVSRGWLPSRWGGPDDAVSAEVKSQLTQEMVRACRTSASPAGAPTTSTTSASMSMSLDAPGTEDSMLLTSTGSSQSSSENRVRSMLLMTSLGGVVVAMTLLGVLRVVRSRSVGGYRSSSSGYQVIVDSRVATVNPTKEIMLTAV